MEGGEVPENGAGGAVEKEGVAEKEVVPLNIVIITPKGKKFEIPLLATDNTQDIRQFLLEYPEMCYITSYHLEYENKTVIEGGELNQIPNLKDGAEFTVIYDDYNETSARLHTRRLREILNMTPGALRKDSPSFYSEFATQKQRVEISPASPKAAASAAAPVNLADYYPTLSNPIKCLKKLGFSGWNPPSGNRRFQGDLFYLEVTTLEGSTYTITASSKGFFVNNTKVGAAFSAEKSEYESHNLVDLLKQVSSKFASTFDELIQSNFQSVPEEIFPVSFPMYTWISLPETPSFDVNRAEEAVAGYTEIDYRIQGQDRDWNEELQACRDQPKESLQERITRDRIMFKIHSDFVQAAIQGAIHIVHGNITPINPTDSPKAFLYVYNAIFFSYAQDSRDYYKDMGGDATAYKQASNDLLGVVAYNRADVNGLYTLGTTLIDYRGQRLVAQTIIPGLFSTLFQERTVVNVGYGSLEGNDYQSVPEFHQVMSEAAEKLHIKPHIVIGKDGSSADLASHADIKGIIGSDSRKYILDLVRTSPRDCNFSAPSDIGALLRPELIERYIYTVHEKETTQKLEELRLREDAKKPEEKKSEEEFLKDLQAIANEKSTFNIFANPDVFTNAHLGDSEEEISKDEAVVKTLGSHLKEEVIPNLIADLLIHRVNPIDSNSITTLLHSRGINMRYLGVIAKGIQKSSPKGFNFTLTILHREMITRVMKHIFTEYFNNSKIHETATTVIAVLNAFFGRIAHSDKGSKSGLNAPSTNSSINHHDLWAQIRKRVAVKYDYVLPDFIPNAMFSVPTLRALCQRVGIQLVAKNYNLASENPFEVADMMRLYPTVKHSQPITSDGQELLEAAKIYSSQGRADIAYELLSEGLAVLHQVYGPMHEQTAQCYSSLARVLHDTDIQSSLQHQQKALIIYERVKGLDHHETVQAYGQLGSICSSFSIHNKANNTNTNTSINNRLAQNYFLRALYLGKVISDPENIDTIDAYTNLGVVLQDSDSKEAIRYLSKALSVAEDIYGANHLLTARLCHLVARAHAAAGEFKEALSFETRNFDVCKKLLGEKDSRTMESNIWMGQFTKNAVIKAKQQLTNQPQKAKVDVKTETQSKDPISGLPLDDLVSYIQGSKNVRSGSIPSSIGGISSNNKRKRVDLKSEVTPKFTPQNFVKVPLKASSPLPKPEPSAAPKVATAEVPKPSAAPKATPAEAPAKKASEPVKAQAAPKPAEAPKPVEEPVKVAEPVKPAEAPATVATPAEAPTTDAPAPATAAPAAAPAKTTNNQKATPQNNTKKGGRRGRK
eukprot:TRINITY_DN3309_c0_g1_i1.p1 TRINITY_DN3309_c0_g1~~TRINITY_DN3309_c0_g1_i1.p1  ORF type:complete len:1374 (+),score=383.46 TRINITY_DN3309_c0_g1_i1:244-4122(+)